MHESVAALDPGKTHPPALTLANYGSARVAGQAPAKSGGDSETPFPRAIGDDAHRIAAKVVVPLENTDGVRRLRPHNAALTRGDLQRIVGVSALARWHGPVAPGEQ